MSVFNGYFSVAEKLYCLRQNFPLRLLHNTLLESFGGVAVFYLYCFLQYDRTAVTFLRYEMDGCSRKLNSLCKGSFVNMKSVISLSAEGGYKSGVNVYHLVGKCTADLLIKDSHKARIHHKVSFFRL